MKTLTAPSEQESELVKWSGAHAKVWLFHVTHNRMVICLFRKGEHESLYIVAVGCEHIAGPLQWDPVLITLVTEQPNSWGEVRRRIVDRQAGFELLCSDVTIVRGALGVPNDPFDGVFR